MHNRYHNKNRAPKIGSSTFFSNKQERQALNSKQYWDANHSAARPERTEQRRQNRHKDKTPKVFKHMLLVSKFQDLTILKSFITFLKKKTDISIEVRGEHLMTSEIFDITELDINAYKYRYSYTITNEAYANLSAEIGVFIRFTHKHLYIDMFREVYRDGDFVISTAPETFETNEYSYLGASLNTTDRLKQILELVNNNIKKPEFITKQKETTTKWWTT